MVVIDLFLIKSNLLTVFKRLFFLISLLMKVVNLWIGQHIYHSLFGKSDRSVQKYRI